MSTERACWLLLSAVVVVVGVACADPKTVLAQTINSNKACDVNEQCVLAGGTDCSCDEAINRGGVPDVEQAAAAVDCCVVGPCTPVTCSEPANLRCQSNQCVVD